MKQFYLIKDILIPPKNVRKEYWNRVVISNHKILMILVVLTMAIQIFNIFRVIFWSRSGLGTVNNRIYFVLYCIMLGGCGIYLVIGPILKKKTSVLRLIQSGAMVFWLLWCTVLNSYDIYKGTAGNAIFVTGLLGCAVCIHMDLLYSLINFAGFTALFHLWTMEAYDFSYLWNCILAMFVALLICYSRFRYTVTDILNQQEILRINNRLIEEKEKLDLNLKKYKYILSQTNNIIFDWNVEQDIVDFSDKWSQTFDLPSHITAFSQWFETTTVLSEETKKQLKQQLSYAAAGKGQVETEVSLNDKNGFCTWFLLQFVFLRDSDGQIKTGLGYLTDINRHKKEVIQLENWGKTDALTGLLNRGAMEGYMRTRVKKIGPKDMLVMLIIDVDNFKHVNDTYGHPCGDKVLQAIAGMLQDRFREGDGIGRIGGDEFMVIFSLRQNMPAVEKKLVKLVHGVPEVAWGKDRICVSISVGAAVWAQDSYENLYKRADRALYQVKQKNKGSYIIDQGLGKDLG
ncbi:MAG TPA: GGDEF domain-containing protein [Candidatus Scybalocola faecavium]|nr:GGDEF domain-containing protein [Candidatus Scybalocola faecavium]